MNRRTAPALFSLLSGLSLSSAFFTPLTLAATRLLFLLQWKRLHTLEFVIAYLALAIGLAGCWMFVTTVQLPRRRAVLALLLCGLPILSFLGMFARHLDILMVTPHALSAVVLVAATTAIASVAFVPNLAWRLIRLSVIGLSPQAVLTFVCFARLVMWSDVVTFRNDELGHTLSPPKTILVLLFDELSYRFLYTGEDVRADYPNFRRLARRSVNYHAASSPGDDTLQSMLGLFAGRLLGPIDVANGEPVECTASGQLRRVRIDGPGSLAALARANGYRLEIVGTYLPYCQELGATVDRCRSYSLYNYQMDSDGLSLTHPFLTNLLAWPHQSVFGLVKNKIALAHQEHLVLETVTLATTGLGEGQRMLRFVHFSVPHMPFFPDPAADGHFNDPFVQTRRNYEAQLRYLDALVGRLVDSVQRTTAGKPSILVVTSDHEFRALSSKCAVRHVPLIVSGSSQFEAVAIRTAVRTDQILRALISGDKASDQTLPPRPPSPE